MSRINLDLEQIQALIPHRAPFLFVTSATIESLSRVQAVAQWAGGNPILAGHFPDFPVVPGVLVVEAAAQVAGILIASNGRQAPGHGVDPVATQRLGVLIGVKRAAFHRPVFAGDKLHFTVQIENQVGGMVTASAQAVGDDGTRIFKGEISVAVVDREALLGKAEAAEAA